MADARISSPVAPLNKVIGTGTVPTAFTAIQYQPTATKPVTANETIVIYDQTLGFPIGAQGLLPEASLLNIIAFSGRSDSTSVGIRVTAWRIYRQTDGTPLYMPTVLYDGTLGYSTAVPSVAVDGSTQNFFGSLTSNGWAPAPSSFSPATASVANSVPCTLTVDPIGAAIVTVSFKAATNGGTMGCLWNTV